MLISLLLCFKLIFQINSEHNIVTQNTMWAGWVVSELVLLNCLCYQNTQTDTGTLGSASKQGGKVGVGVFGGLMKSSV